MLFCAALCLSPASVVIGGAASSFEFVGNFAEELVAESSRLPSGQTLWSSAFDVSRTINAGGDPVRCAEQLRQQLAGCTGLIFLVTPDDQPHAAATWYSRLLDAAPLGPPRRSAAFCTCNPLVAKTCVGGMASTDIPSVRPSPSIVPSAGASIVDALDNPEKSLLAPGARLTCAVGEVSPPCS